MVTATFQPSDSYDQALDRAARVWGIEPEYGDTWGQLHHTSAETKKAILAALGVPSSTREELDAAVEARLWEDWNRLLPPASVLSEKARSFRVHLPAALADRPLKVEFRWESGEITRRLIALSEVPGRGRAELRGAGFQCKEISLPEGAPLGYHEIYVSLDGHSASMRLILCPDHAYVPAPVRDGRRSAGLAIALYGLRSARNWGCGDLTDLENMCPWLARDLGVAFVGLNPLHAIGNRQPYNTSPYLPTSAFYKNPIYLDVERIDDFRRSPRAQRLFSQPAVRAEIESLRTSEFVEYEKVYALKLRALKLAFLEFLHSDRNGAEFLGYVDREGELLDNFATFCALDEAIHRRTPTCWVWPDWPAEYRDPRSKEVARFKRRYWRAVLFHKYVQWQLDQQLESAQVRACEAGLEIGLYHDLALATDSCGADLWAHRRYYVGGCRVGAPPDGFSPKGQDWSFPPPDSAQHRTAGYRLFTESIRANCRHGGALRIDHVMRFFRLYWIPAGMDATQGAYVRDRYEDLLHILALESVRHKVAIVGEDLGTVTDEIRSALDRFGLFGYRVLYFEKNGHGNFRPPQDYSERALVSSTTHDLPTLAGFWLARDIEARHAAGLLHHEDAYRHQLAERGREKQKLLDSLFSMNLLPEGFPRSAGDVPDLNGDLHYALIGWLASARSLMLALNQEDLTKEPEQQNLPASTWQYPNWCRKMRFAVEDLDTSARDFTAMFRYWLERTGRTASSVAAD